MVRYIALLLGLKSSNASNATRRAASTIKSSGTWVTRAPNTICITHCQPSPRPTKTPSRKLRKHAPIANGESRKREVVATWFVSISDQLPEVLLNKLTSSRPQLSPHVLLEPTELRRREPSKFCRVCRRSDFQLSWLGRRCRKRNHGNGRPRNCHKYCIKARSAGTATLYSPSQHSPPASCLRRSPAASDC